MSDTRARLEAALHDRYRIERELGAGGMASVYLAHDLRHGRDVAVKVLAPDVGRQPVSERFLREIRIAAGLSHPHILPVFDSGDENGLLYFVMPYARGQTLRARLTEAGALPVDEAIGIVSDVAAALASAHEAGIVHRDIKPENVLLESGQALVADFGVARALDAAGAARLTRTGLAIGTPAYMSPEQVAADPSADARSDQYGLACVAYELLTGRPPFAGSSVQAVIAGHVARPVPAMRASRDGIPPSVEAAVRRALEKDPADRFASVSEFADALRSANTLAGRDVYRRRRRLEALGGAALLGVIAFSGWVALARLGGPHVERLAVLPVASLTGQPDQAYVLSGVHQALVSELQRAGIPTTARQSVLQYRDTDKPVEQIARELGVDALVEPAAALVGDSVFVQVALIEASSQLPLWSARYDRHLSGLLGLYREVSESVAREVGIALSPEGAARAAARPTLDEQAQRDYFRGLDHLGRFTPLDFDRARASFESAIEREPEYVEAYLGLRSVWMYQAQIGLLAPAEVRARTDSLLDRALEIDPRHPAALSILANTSVWRDWDLEAGARAFEAALAVDSLDGRTRAFHGHLLTILGRWDEAAMEMERGVDLDRLDPFIQGLYGAQLTMVGRFDRALSVLERLFEETPDAGFGDVFYALALHEAGRHEEELAIRRQNHVTRGEAEIADAMERGFGANGHAGAAEAVAEALIALRRERHVPALTIATSLVEAGRTDEAIEWLRVDVADRGANVPYYGVLPPLWPLHDHPEFRAMLDELGLTPFEPDGR